MERTCLNTEQYMRNIRTTKLQKVLELNSKGQIIQYPIQDHQNHEQTVDAGRTNKLLKISSKKII